jgi:hypothetical protein
MKFRSIAAAAAALSFAASPAMAQAERATAPTSKKDELGGPSIILAILAVAAIIAGIVIAADSGDDSAVSP